LNAIVISGSGFDSVNLQNNLVYIGSVLCTITQATSTQLTCSNGLNSIGTYSFTVNVLGSGLAVMNSNPSVTYQLTTTSLSPSSSGVGGRLNLNIFIFDLIFINILLIRRSIVEYNWNTIQFKLYCSSRWKQLFNCFC